MPKVVDVKEPKADYYVTLFSLRPGECGCDVEGNVYFRTIESAVCLNESGNSFMSIICLCNVMVIKYPKGTTITIEV